MKESFFQRSPEQEESILFWAYDLNYNVWSKSFVWEMIVNFQEQQAQTFLKVWLTSYLQNQQ